MSYLESFTISRAIAFLMVIGLLSSCTSQDISGERKYMPAANGQTGDIVVVMDSLKWAGPVGDLLRDIFTAPVQGLPQDEPQFKLRHVDPRKMTKLIKQSRNLMYVTLLDDESRSGRLLKNSFPKEAKQKIKDNPSLFMLPRDDEFAKGQKLIHLFGATNQTLIDNLQKNRNRLLTYMHNSENDRVKEEVYSGKEKVALSKRISERHEFALRIPATYELADEQEDFVWLRNLETEIDKSVFVSYINYTSQDVFEEENVLKLRESITSKYLRDIEKPEKYITYQPIFPIKTEKFTFNGNFAVKGRGLWRVNDNSLGGPYICYVFVDEALNRLYYVEGFVAAPGKDKKELIRELEIILSTFKTKEQLESKTDDEKT
ncbi:DUF4837 family protein [Fulvivirgaceae bacterium BMA10]|uniref:DUF4837 family protein n=1 Tax=Splendidivirga corallicola TaxID=3051826 RepID=A0ABT8KT51_9BACT|nr:DUF4837 family protein [Fulvivirgaceae bacterium BMA10]